MSKHTSPGHLLVNRKSALLNNRAFVSLMIICGLFFNVRVKHGTLQYLKGVLWSIGRVRSKQDVT